MLLLYIMHWQESFTVKGRYSSGIKITLQMSSTDHQPFYRERSCHTLRMERRDTSKSYYKRKEASKLILNIGSTEI